MKLFIRTAAVIVAAVTLTSCTPTPAASADEATAPPEVGMVVVTLNVHGGTDRAGGGNRGRVPAVAADVLALVARHQPTVVALQELCGRQYRDLRGHLGRLGYAAAFTSTQRQSGCNDRAHGNQFGNAIFVRGGIQTRYVWALPWGANARGVTGRQPRRLLCVKPLGQSWRACVTQLSPHDPDVTRQAARVAVLIARWSGRVVLAGDLNLSPTWVTRMFPGRSAAGVGIDHVVSSGPASVVAVEVVCSSDHPALVAAA